MSTAIDTEPPSDAFKARYPEVFGRPFLARWRPLIVLLAVVAYCAYAIWFFAIPSVIINAHWERTGIYLAQWISHDVRLELRTGGGKVETRWEIYSPLGKDPHPSWVVPNVDGSVAVEVAGAGNGIVVAPSTVTIIKAGEQVTFAMGGDVPRAEGPVPSWVQIKEDEVRANWGFRGTVSFDADRIKVARRFLGWANFIFDTTSPFFGKSPGEVLGLIFFGPRIDPDKSNLTIAFENIWNNTDWQHGDVWTKLFQTMVMAFAGTLLAALVAFPLSFLAARNITRNRFANQGFKRFFDFQRSVDMLIWALFFTRAFGPGPLAGVGAIFFTETGTFGKLYSEALENIDDKQPEGVKSVGASPLLVRRFGILPQVFPVFASQTLYFWESNTRSATIIGAVGAGGIGLKLWEAMQTNTNWANVLYMVILILFVVYAFDNFSNRLRRRLIGDLPI